MVNGDTEDWSETADRTLVSGPADGGFPQPGDTAVINDGSVEIAGATFRVAVRTIFDG